MKAHRPTHELKGEEVDIVLCVVLSMYSKCAYLHCHERKHKVRMAAGAAWGIENRKSFT